MSVNVYYMSECTSTYMTKNAIPTSKDNDSTEWDPKWVFPTKSKSWQSLLMKRQTWRLKQW